jgi:hypothetical protein
MRSLKICTPGVTRVSQERMSYLPAKETLDGTELTYDTPYSQLPAIDYWTQ